MDPCVVMTIAIVDPDVIGGVGEDEVNGAWGDEPQPLCCVHDMDLVEG